MYFSNSFVSNPNLFSSKLAFQYLIPLFIIIESASPRLALFFCLLIGGGGGNRTRVRKPGCRSFYKLSPGFVSRAVGSPEQDPTLPVPLGFPQQRRDSRCNGRPVF